MNNVHVKVILTTKSGIPTVYSNVANLDVEIVDHDTDEIKRAEAADKREDEIRAALHSTGDNRLYEVA